MYTKKHELGVIPHKKTIVCYFYLRFKKMSCKTCHECMAYCFRVLDHKRKQEMSNLLSTTVPNKKQCLPYENHDPSPATEFVDEMSNGIPQRPNTLSASVSQNSVNTRNSNPIDIFHSVFYYSTITGGTFNMNITFVSNDSKRT